MIPADAPPPYVPQRVARLCAVRHGRPRHLPRGKHKPKASLEGLSSEARRGETVPRNAAPALNLATLIRPPFPSSLLHYDLQYVKHHIHPYRRRCIFVILSFGGLVNEIILHRVTAKNMLLI